MTTLYRTPNIVIDHHEWHASVELRDGRIYRRFKFRPLSIKPFMWQPIDEWKSHKPKGFQRSFRAFKMHMVQAERSVAENGRVARALAA